MFATIQLTGADYARMRAPSSRSGAPADNGVIFTSPVKRRARSRQRGDGASPVGRYHRLRADVVSFVGEFYGADQSQFIGRSLRRVKILAPHSSLARLQVALANRFGASARAVVSRVGALNVESISILLYL